MHLSGLFIYPVKSLRGHAVAKASVDALGLVGDRRFMVVDENGRHLTQRTVPRMALITPTLESDRMILSAAHAGAVSVPLRANAPATLCTVSIWRSHGLHAEDGGDEPAAWLSALLGVHCRLVRIGGDFHRPILLKPAYSRIVPAAASEWIEGRVVSADPVHFADGYPFMVTSEASLADVNARLAAADEDPVGMDRFRPSLVIAGCEAFAEDTWPRLRIGELVFRAAGPCSRCIVTTTDQLTGERRGSEPLRTLATYRRDPRDPTDVNFGQNLVHETKSGTLRVGDPVQVLAPDA